MYRAIMVQRPVITEALQTALNRSRIVALLGPRQCGKTTLARQFVSPDSPHYFDLEDPLSLARLDEPMMALRNLKGIVVIDEIQRRPSCFLSFVSWRIAILFLPDSSFWEAHPPRFFVNRRNLWPAVWRRFR